MLEKREEFYNILYNTLVEWHPSGTKEDVLLTEFIANKFLNFIAHPNLTDQIFSNLVAEYGTSTSLWKNLLQKAYVNLAVSQTFRKKFSHKSISLPYRFHDKLILGGNHRLRIFNSGLQSSTVILKKGEAVEFIENEIQLKRAFDLTYAPTLIKAGSNWLEEEYVKGLPLNRIKYVAGKQDFIKKLIALHFEQLLIPAKVQLNVQEYRYWKNEKLQQKLQNPQLKISSEIRNQLEETFDFVSKRLQYELVDLSWSHGDFQEGNVLVDGDHFKVIDWEAAEKRFWLYDIFVLIGDLRAHGDVKEALNRFENFVSRDQNRFEMPIDWQQLLLIEELLYAVYEDCSPNFYQSGVKAARVCDQIKALLDI